MLGRQLPPEGEWCIHRTTKEKFWIDLVELDLVYLQRQDGSYYNVPAREFEEGFDLIGDSNGVG